MPFTETFPDRRVQFFGREADVRHLIDRANRSGLTVVLGRPLMGKTWTLNEAARRLLEEGRYLIGYHESKGAESSHLLYAVSNLYSRWLADSSMRNQAISLWEQHKTGLVPAVGQMVGRLFQVLGKVVAPSEVATAIRHAFDDLAQAQKNLLSGGIATAPLPYDQALSLTTLVAKVSGLRVGLILDAWEKSPSIQYESRTLESFLKDLANWPHTHIFLAVRDPEIGNDRMNDAYHRAWGICRINRAAEMYELGPMDLRNPQESIRLVRFIQGRVTAAKSESEKSILEMIAGYPGVLDFWTNAAVQTSMRTRDDLLKEANNAQSLRYLELDQLLERLNEPQCALAARLAIFPRLDVGGWETFREMLLKDQPETVIDKMIDDKVFVDDTFPTYGHDTRHAAAQRWFIQHIRCAKYSRWRCANDRDSQTGRP